MSAPTTPLARPPPWFLRPSWFLVGFVLGLIVMSVLGRRAGQTDFHPEFTRFFPPISPEGNYFPTVDEMSAIVRARCRPDQVLVLVGGNSVLQGVWQPADKMWTRHLQADLGDKYCVINLALRGAMPTDGGAVVAEALRREFPHLIYIANERAMNGLYPLGNEVYRPIFWQAYFGGYLLSYGPRDAAVRKYFLTWGNRWSTLGVVGAAWLDRWLHFNNFWTRTAFVSINTIPSLYTPAPPGMFSPRSMFQDSEPDGSDTTLEQRYPEAGRATEMKIIRAASESFYELRPDGTWRLLPKVESVLDQRFNSAMPPSLRSRTLILVGRDASFFRSQFSPAELARDEQSIADGVRLLRANGYAAMDYGRGFGERDYGDRSHLSPSGGEKLAAAVAPEVVQLSQKLGYLK